MMTPRLSFRRLLPFAAVAFSVVACSNTTVGDLLNESVASSPAAFVSEYCGLLAPCCDRAGLYRDEPRCKEALANLSAATNFDPEKGAACLKELRLAKELCDYAADSPSAPSCRAILKQSGIKQLGQACSDARDCGPSPEGWVDCVSTFQSGAQARTCQLRLVGKEGDGPCVATVDEDGLARSSSDLMGSGAPPAPRGFTCSVDAGLRCDDTSKKCARLLELGDRCNGLLSDVECPKNARCSRGNETEGNPTDWLRYECVARLPLGAACDTRGGTFVDLCDKSEFCDPSAKRCVPRAVAGAPCTTSLACLNGSCVNGLCRKFITLDLGPVCGGQK